MHRALALLDLALILATAGGAVAGRSRLWGWPLLLASGAWLPLNNGLLEGPVILGVSGDHGLTVSDLLGIVGAVAGGVRLWPPRRGRSGSWLAARAGAVAAVVVIGFVTAMIVTNDRVDDRERRFRDRQPQGPAERALAVGPARAQLDRAPFHSCSPGITTTNYVR